MTFRSHIGRMYDSDVWYAYLHVPAEIAEPFITEGDLKYRVILTLNDTETWHCALMHRGDGDYFINVNKDIRTRLELEEHTEVTATLKKDTSQYGMELPAELRELFDLDPEGATIFHQLTPGKQRALLYQVAKPKGAATRIRKAVTIVEYLKSTRGRLDFKELNEAYRERRFT